MIGHPAVTATPLSMPHVPRAHVRGGKLGSNSQEYRTPEPEHTIWLLKSSLYR